MSDCWVKLKDGIQQYIP